MTRANADARRAYAERRLDPALKAAILPGPSSRRTIWRDYAEGRLIDEAAQAAAEAR
jgi:hypothetical protein